MGHTELAAKEFCRVLGSEHLVDELELWRLLLDWKLILGYIRALILRAPRNAHRGPHPHSGGGRVSAWRRTQGRITFLLLAQRQAQPKRS